jgi:hypothetical protein
MGVGTITGVDIPPAREHPGRPVLERVLAFARWPLSWALAVVARRPATSRMRRRALLELLSRGFAGATRGDYWFVPIAYEPDCEIFSAPEFRALGLADCYRGHAGWRELIDTFTEPISDVRWVPEHVIDLGDRWVLRLGMSGTGRRSGVPTHETWGTVYHMSPRGRIARQDFHWTWEDALAATGAYVGR